MFIGRGRVSRKRRPKAEDQRPRKGRLLENEDLEKENPLENEDLENEDSLKNTNTQDKKLRRNRVWLTFKFLRWPKHGLAFYLLHYKYRFSSPINERKISKNIIVHVICFHKKQHDNSKRKKRDTLKIRA